MAPQYRLETIVYKTRVITAISGALLGVGGVAGENCCQQDAPSRGGDRGGLAAGAGELGRVGEVLSPCRGGEGRGHRPACVLSVCPSIIPMGTCGSQHSSLCREQL